jgi:signal transduction histidine kinase
MTDSQIRREFTDPSPMTRILLDAFEPEVMLIDADYHITFMNRKKRDRYPHVQPGNRCYEVFEIHGRRCPHCVAHRAMTSQAPQTNPNYSSLDPVGNLRHVNIHVTPVLDEEGETVGAIEVLYDVEETFQTNEQLTRLNREYESVIYALSHDLRSPLVSIEGFVRKLERGHVPPEDEIAHHCIERIRANVRNMNDFVKVLLDTSRIATGKFEMQPVAMSEIVEDVIHQFDNQLKSQGARLVVKGEFPTLSCDRVRMLQVFSNLVGNALSHCKGTPNLEIELGYKDGVFWVSDNGPGMDEEFKDRVFEPFSQGAKSDEHFGMGMNIVYKILNKHGGQVWIETSPSQGTCVMFTLDPKRR